MTSAVSANHGENEATVSEGRPVLELRDIVAGYGSTTVVREVDLVVGKGEFVALLGPNGAGKTTLLRTASGLLKPAKGTVRIGDADMTAAPAHRRARAGLCLIPEGRGVFRNLTVRDNLRMQIPAWIPDKSFEPALDAFPALRGRMSQLAGTLSGGQQQMLALARAYLSRAEVILLDEVSMGLAPKVVDEIFHRLAQLASTGVAILLVEQYVTRALEMADQVVLLDRGRVSFTGAPDQLEQDEMLRRYFGVEIG
jgi:branched-chain amino acid transport system ATP-binding protein